MATRLAQTRDGTQAHQGPQDHLAQAEDRIKQLQQALALLRTGAQT